MFVKILIKLLLFLLGTVLVIALVGGALLFAGKADNVEKSDVCLILGGTVDSSGKPSAGLKARLDRAVELYNDEFVSQFIVSGGLGAEGHEEVAAMDAYLVAQGVPEGNVIIDNQGATTYDSAKNAKAIMSERGFESITVVTQHFHIVRSRFALQKFGVSPIYTAHAKHFEKSDLYSTLNEVGVLAKYATLSYDEE